MRSSLDVYQGLNSFQLPRTEPSAQPDPALAQQWALRKVLCHHCGPISAVSQLSLGMFKMSREADKLCSELDGKNHSLVMRELVSASQNETSDRHIPGERRVPISLAWGSSLAPSSCLVLRGWGQKVNVGMFTVCAVTSLSTGLPFHLSAPSVLQQTHRLQPRVTGRGSSRRKSISCCSFLFLIFN